jgi:regulator of protease activity HflC (stomatin/prohibitin superfamily)
MELDAAFEAKEEIALEVKNALRETMKTFGFSILQCLVTDLNPDGGATPLFTPRHPFTFDTP